MVPLHSDAGAPHGFPTNKDFVVQLLIGIIICLFPNLNKVQTEAFVWKLFNTSQEWQAFKSTLRDLLVSMKSFSSVDDQLYEEERKVSSLQLLNPTGCTGGVEEARDGKAQRRAGPAEGERAIPVKRPNNY